MTVETTATPTPLHHSTSHLSVDLPVSPEAVTAGRTVCPPLQGLEDCKLQAGSGQLWPLYKTELNQNRDE